MDNADQPVDNLKVIYQEAGYARIPEGGETKAETGGKKTKKRGKADTLKFLLPIRPKTNKTRSAMDTSGLISTIMLSFLTHIFWKAHRKGITQETLMPLKSENEAAAVNCDRLERLWQEELKMNGEGSASLKRVVLKFVRTRILVSSLVLVISSSSGFLLMAYLLFLAITYLESTEDSIRYCVVLAFSVFISAVVRVLGWNVASFLNIRSAVRLRSGVMMLLYRKVMRLRTTSNVSVGEMVNICVNDIQRLHDAIVFGPLLLTFPVFLISIVAGVVLVIGIEPTIVGVATLILFFCILVWFF